MFGLAGSDIQNQSEISEIGTSEGRLILTKKYIECSHIFLNYDNRYARKIRESHTPLIRQKLPLKPLIPLTIVRSWGNVCLYYS